LDAAAAALEASTRLLSTFVFSSADDVIEKYYAGVRASEVKLRGAMDAFRDHLVEAT
jgi:hypothetical protein